jgi:peptidyl-prolyl cis-trans isomerase D
MLRGLRKASSGWLGKTVMAAVVGFLIISFGIWGIGDIFHGFGSNTVAKIGRTEITIDQFRNRYNEELQQFSRRIGRPITPDQARALGIEQQLLSQLMAFAALDEHARQLGLTVSDEELNDQIRQNPVFHGVNGNFDPQIFMQRLRDNGFTEPRFRQDERQGITRRQIAEAIGSDIVAPKTAVEAVEHFRNEERSVDYVVLDANSVGEIPAPTPEQLASYFDEHKFAFRAPEYRKIALMTLSQQELGRTIAVSDEDAKRAYDERINRYSVPERRTVQQIVFPNAEDAQKAATRLAEGASFEDIAKDLNLADKDIDLGTVTKREIIDPAVGTAAFGLADGAVSAPVKGLFGTVIVKVTKIEPGSTKAFAEVEAEIRRDIGYERAKAEVSKLRDKVEDGFGEGLRVDQIAKANNIPLRTIDAVDRSGRTPDGNLVAGLPAGVDVVSAAFSTEVGNENDPLQLQGGGFVWYDVLEITPSRERKLDEVKDRVEARWREDETIKRLDAKTTEIVDKLKAGTPLADIAAADMLKVETKWGIKRQGTDLLPPGVVAAVFRAPKDGDGTADGKSPTERYVFRVTDIKVAPFDPNAESAKAMSDQLKAAYNDELLSEYIARLESDLGTTINQAGLAQAVGRGAPQ